MISARVAPHLTLVRPPRPAELDDAALAEAAAEGRPGAAAALWDRYAAPVHGLLRRVLGPGADVEDHAQETFIRFFHEVTRLRDPRALRSFLFGIAVRVARSELRRRRFRRWLSLTDRGELPDLPVEGADVTAREAVRRLYIVLDALDDEGRTLFVLRQVEGLDLPEIAAACGLSLATVKRRLVKVGARVHAMAARDPILLNYLAPLEEDADG